jgi:hypothetical protein
LAVKFITGRLILQIAGWGVRPTTPPWLKKTQTISAGQNQFRWLFIDFKAASESVRRNKVQILWIKSLKGTTAPEKKKNQ